MKDKCRVLHVMYGVDCGGVEAVVYNYYSNMNRDKIHFDVVAQAEKGEDVTKNMFAEKLRKIGANVFYIPTKSDNIIDAMKKLMGIIKNGNYDIVHIHMGQGSVPYVLAAKICGIKNIVVHTHIAHDVGGWSDRVFTRLMGQLLKLFKTQKMACSEDAAEIWQREPVYVLNNALNVENYRFSNAKRDEMRKQLKLEGHTAICTVARLDENKNHSFLLDIFAEYTEIDSSARLVLVGTGAEQNNVEEKAKGLNIYDKLLFLGAREDVPDILQGMDAFALPSNFEGFGIVYVEAQLAGLPCFAIDGAVPKAVELCELMTFMPKGAAAKEWAEKIHDSIGQKADQEQIFAKAKEKGLDILAQTKKLEEYYFKLMEEK